jgi:hypothetical protein
MIAISHSSKSRVFSRKKIKSTVLSFHGTAPPAGGTVRLWTARLCGAERRSAERVRATAVAERRAAARSASLSLGAGAPAGALTGFKNGVLLIFAFSELGYSLVKICCCS